ncbi:MAG: cyclic nucleotide-binding domain-containing protein [Elusimicrobia bacterium]|nr:cyclic nucleotide-binding domain-containing protein [Elusimicrobiota bacterium]
MPHNLKKVPIFSDLPEDILEAISVMVEEKLYADGAVIFSEGQAGATFYVIRQGEVIISKLKALAILQSGDFFGEMSLIDQSPRSASAIAKGKVILYALSRNNFQELLNSNLQAAQIFIFKLLETLVQRLRQTDRELVTVYETGKIIASFFDLKKTCIMVLHKIMEATESAEAGMIVVWNEFSREFEVQAQANLPPAELDRITLDAQDPLIKCLLDTKEYLLIKELNADERFNLKSARPYYGPSIIASPLVSRDIFIGFIILLNKDKTNAFSLDQVNMLSGIAAQVSQAVENIKHQEEEKSRQRLQNLKQL